MLVATVGYEEAAKRTGIKAATLRKWNERYQWKVIPTHALAVTNVTKPSDALASVLAEDNRKTKIGLSKATRKAAETMQEYDGEKVIKASRNLKDIVGAASQLHNWEAQEAGSGVMGGLRVYSQQTVMHVQVGKTPTPQAT